MEVRGSKRADRHKTEGILWMVVKGGVWWI